MNYQKLVSFDEKYFLQKCAQHASDIINILRRRYSESFIKIGATTEIEYLVREIGNTLLLMNETNF